MPEEPEARPPRPAPRRRRTRRPGRGRVLLIGVAVFLIVGISFLRAAAGAYTDYLWFDSLGRSSVFTGILRAKLGLSVTFTVGFFALLWVNLTVADRVAPSLHAPGPEEELVVRYHQLVGDRTRLVRFGVAGLFALMAGAGPAAQWNEWLLFRHGGRFGGTPDALFGRDPSWYVFKLPFLGFLAQWLLVAFVIVLILTAITHYLNGGIRLQLTGADRVTPQVKVHLSVLLAAIAFVKAFGYWLQQFGLTTSTRGIVDGATYTDVNVQLPAIKLLILVAVAAALLFLVNVRRKGWVLPVLGVGIWALVAVVGGAIVPSLVQWARVKPSESTREREFIARNIEATREALGLAAVEPLRFTPDFSLTDDDLAANADVLDNVRLWDPAFEASVRTFDALQALRAFYSVGDVDIDRYEIDGQVRQVAIGARNLDTANSSQQSWQSTHLSFTHGYGLIAAPTNTKESDGSPAFSVGDVPVVDSDGLRVERPQLYIGEGQSGYVIVGADRPETDYTDAEGVAQSTSYNGRDGVGIGSLVRRLAFSLSFADPNPLFSGNIRPESRVLYHRDVEDRVKTLAPFLSLDQDPYPVLADGRIYWVVDAYTVSDAYPYAQRAITDDGLAGSDLDRRFNYIRNSVKVVVDAYEGTVDLYVVDDTDPIIAAYRSAFPTLFADEPMPDFLLEHRRYPEDIFRVQSNMWGRYHLDDPDQFFTQENAWVVPRIPPTPSAQRSAQPSSNTTTTTDPNAAPRQRNRVAPFYSVTRIPGQDELSFQLIRPFQPFSPDDSREQLTGYLVAGSDGDDYGRLVSVEVASSDVDGPGLAANSINSEPDISLQQSLLCAPDGGSLCEFGSIVLVPIDNAILYVQPLYVRANREGAASLLRLVIVQYNGRVGVADTLEGALADLPEFEEVPDLNDTPISLPPPDDGQEPGPDENPPPDDADAAELLRQAEALFAEAEQALRDGGSDGFATYQEKLAQARALVARAEALLTGGPAPTTTTTSTTVPAEPA